MNYHKAVLLQEAVDALKVQPGKKYIDATLGGGGHTSEILNLGGVVLALDQDVEAIAYVSNSGLKTNKLEFGYGNFRNIDELAKEKNFEQVSGILFDLGVSSHQLEEAERGFSYLKSGPLDMRMDQRLGVKAADLVNALSKTELIEIFRGLGEERRAQKVVDLIIKRRKIAPFKTTDDLALTLATAYGFKNIDDFAKATSSKRVFQALRIQVNDELGSVKEALPKALSLLEDGGRIVVITFHSLEDRIVKHEFEAFEREGKGKVITKKPILPTEEEMKVNSRSKSAKMRIFEYSASKV